MDHQNNLNISFFKKNFDAANKDVLQYLHFIGPQQRTVAFPSLLAGHEQTVLLVPTFSQRAPTPQGDGNLSHGS